MTLHELIFWAVGRKLLDVLVGAVIISLKNLNTAWCMEAFKVNVGV